MSQLPVGIGSPGREGVEKVLPAHNRRQGGREVVRALVDGQVIARIAAGLLLIEEVSPVAEPEHETESPVSVPDRGVPSGIP